MGRPVKVAFLGDTDDLVKSMGKAEAAMDGAAAEAQAAGDKIDRSFSGVADAADGVASGSAQAAGGLGDLGGALSALPGPLGKLGTGMEAAAPAIMGVTGAADLLNLATEKFPGLAKVASKASKAFALAQRAVGVAVRFAMGPFGIALAVFAALAALFVVLYKRNDRFRAIVDRVMARVSTALGSAGKAFGKLRDKIGDAFQWVKSHWPLLLAILTGPIGLAVLVIAKKWGAIKTGATAVKDWVVRKFNRLVDFVRNLPGRIGDAASGIWDSIASNFKGMLNKIVGWWNNLSLHLDIPDAIPGLPDSFTINTPNVPYLASGGIVTRPTLAVIGEAGPEAVVPLNGRYGVGGGDTYVLKVSVPATANPAETGRQIVRAIEAFERAGGRRRA